MGVLDSIRNLFRRSSTEAAAPTATPRTGAVSLLPVNGGSALNVATVYRCVNLLADAVANLPVQYMRKKGDIFVEDRSSRLHYLLNVQPCSYMSAVDFWRQVVQYLLLNGNASIVPIYDYLFEKATPSPIFTKNFLQFYPSVLPQIEEKSIFFFLRSPQTRRRILEFPHHSPKK